MYHILLLLDSNSAIFNILYRRMKIHHTVTGNKVYYTNI